MSSSAYNGFVFLYHLAYQLCVVSKDARNNEKRRLVDLFEDAIKKDAIKNEKTTVEAGKLFNYTR